MNKYANEYLDILKQKTALPTTGDLLRIAAEQAAEQIKAYKPLIKAYKPFNQDDANTTGAALGAGLGAVAGGGIGALSGLVSDPGYDEQGQRKSRIKASLRGLIGGGAIGAGAGALGAVALPTLGRGGVDLDTQIRKRISSPSGNSTSFMGRILNRIRNNSIEAEGENRKLLLPFQSVQDLRDMYNKKPLPVEPSVLQKIQNLFKGTPQRLSPNPSDLSPAHRSLSPYLKKYFNDSGDVINTQPFY